VRGGEGTGFVHSSLFLSLPVCRSPHLSIAPSPAAPKSPATSLHCPPGWVLVPPPHPGLCEMFPGVSAWWGGAFFPIIYIFFFSFFFFFPCFSRHVGLGPVSPPGWASPPCTLLASSLHPPARAVPLRFGRSPCLLGGFLSASRAAQSAVKSIARAVAVGSRLGSFLLRLPSLPAPLRFPQAEFFRLRTSPQQPLLFIFFPRFYLFFMHFPPYLPLFPLLPACGGGCGRAPARHSPAWALDFSF